MYLKEQAYVRLELHLGKAKALAQALPDGVLEGLTLLDLPSFGKEISRLLVLRAADQVGLWAIRRQSHAALLEGLMRDETLSGGGVLRLLGMAVAVELVGEEALLAACPADKKRTLYRVAKELRDRRLLPSGNDAAAEYAEALYKELAQAPAHYGERIEWRGQCGPLAEAIRAERDRRAA